MHFNKTCMVTGAAGFIGSHIARRLLSEEHTVIGIDCFTDYYDRQIKEANISDLQKHPSFKLIEDDIVNINHGWVSEVDWVFHQATQAGVRASWGEEFAHYTHHNILGTQRLL